jgi:predicted metal-dependent hydrolase
MSVVSNIERKLTGNDQAKEDMVMAVAPHSNWVQQILPAPAAVATLAKLAYLGSSSIDFPMVEPAGGFKWIKYPDSFKASLTQLCNEGYEAFALSHEAMDDVRLSTLSIPTDMRLVVKVLVQGEDYEIEDHLPLALGAIEDAATTCSRRGQQVVDKYSSVMELIDELSETGQATKGKNEAEAAKLKLEKKKQEMNRKYQKEMKEDYEKEVEEVKKQMDKREKEYEKALDDMPGPWATLALNCVGSIVDRIGGGGGQGQEPSQAPEGQTQQTEAPKRMSPATKNFYATEAQHHALAIETGQETLFADVGSFAKDPAHLNAMRFHFEQAVKILADPKIDAKVRAEVEPFYKAVQATLDKVSPNDDTNAPAVKQELEEHHKTALKLLSSAAEILQKPLQGTTPERAKLSKANGGSGRTPGFGERAAKTAQAKIEITQKTFENTQKRYNKSMDELLETEHKLNATLVNLAEKVDSLASTEEILKMLKEGLILLGELKQQWASLSEFFTEMANMIKKATERTYLFVDTSRKEMDRRVEGRGKVGMGEVTKDLIYSYARESVTIGYVVQKLAKSYVNISRDHLLGPIAGLPSMLALDGKDREDRTKIQKQKDHILKQCIAAQQAIKYMIDDEKKDFKRDLDSRMNVISQEFGKLTSSLSPAQKQEIKETVEEGNENALEVKDELDEW